VRPVCDQFCKIEDAVPPEFLQSECGSGGSGHCCGGSGLLGGGSQQCHYPGFHGEAAAMLLETGASSIAVDTLSLDHGMSPDFATHYLWLPAGRFGIENIANLDQMPASGATIFIGAPKHKGGTGGPARVMAMV